MSSPFNLDPQSLDLEEDVRKPNIPMAVYHQEANDLLVFLSKGDNWKRLLGVGLHADARVAAEQALTASRAAQSTWYIASRPRKEEEHTVRELRASELRSEAMSACRYNLRANRGLQGALDRIEDGSGLADLAADCTDLAKLIHENVAAFQNDETFAAKAVADELAELGPLIAAATSERRAEPGVGPLVESRDRAFTILDDILAEVRVAGRHAFRKSDDVRRFASDYERRTSSRARRRKVQSPTTPS